MLLTSDDLSQLDDPDFAPTHVSHFCFLSHTEGMSQPMARLERGKKSYFHFPLFINTPLLFLMS